MMLPRFLQFENYEVIDFKEFIELHEIHIYLKRKDTEPGACSRCHQPLSAVCRGDHPMKLESLPIMGFRTFIHFRRFKFHCGHCQRARSEAVSFLSAESPHFTTEYAWWIGRLCEISPVSRTAELINQDGTTIWRLDYHRMIRLLSTYKLPKIKRISVDEVYARKRRKSDETQADRDERFFTVVTDLSTHKVIWVSLSRKKKALDEFFNILGPEGCRQIEAVALDQHEAYAASVKEHCPQAKIVWDRFHIMQNFEVAVNEARQEILESSVHDDVRQKARGRFKYLFLKKASRRTEAEKLHINEVMRLNSDFYRLELIKERMMTFFDQPTLKEAELVFEEIGEWIYQSGFKSLIDWYRKLESGWGTLSNYFENRLTTSVSEGINNTIKTLKRKAFGYRNMGYFRLKIMQVCGFLNSRYCTIGNQ